MYRFQEKQWFPLGLNWSNIQTYESLFFTFLTVSYFWCILKRNGVLQFCDTGDVRKEERRRGMSSFYPCVTARECLIMELAKVGWTVTPGKEGSQLCCQLCLYCLHTNSRGSSYQTKPNQTRYSTVPVYTHGNRKVQSGYLHGTTQKHR